MKGKVGKLAHQKILILEDNELDAQLIREEVGNSGLKFTSSHVSDGASFKKALVEFKPDIILSDFCLPSYDGFIALEDVRKNDDEIPFIFVSGAIGEDLAIEALKRGATDCVNKNHLGKLPSAIRRAIGETEERRQRRRAEQALERLRYRNSLILDSAGEGILGLDTDLRIVFINRSGLVLLGYDIKEIVGEMPGTFLRDGGNDDLFSMLTRFDTENDGGQPEAVSFKLTIWKKNGGSFPAECTLSPMREEDSIAGFVFTISDVSERVKAQEEIERGYISLRNLLFDSIHAMSIALEFRDPYTAGHQMRVAGLAVAIAKELKISEEQVRGVYLAGIVHDIGKINVPSDILSRPSKLTNPEYQLIQVHAEAGYKILRDVDYPWPIAETVYQHHERLDGSGYPRKLAGDAIILEARIIAVADVVEAMASHRPYRPALGIEAALDEIRKGSGNIYDEKIVDACLSVFEKGFTF